MGNTRWRCLTLFANAFYLITLFSSCLIDLNVKEAVFPCKHFHWFFRGSLNEKEIRVQKKKTISIVFAFLCLIFIWAYSNSKYTWHRSFDTCGKICTARCVPSVIHRSERKNVVTVFEYKCCFLNCCPKMSYILATILYIIVAGSGLSCSISHKKCELQLTYSSELK